MLEIEIPYKPRPQFESFHDRTERFSKVTVAIRNIAGPLDIKTTRDDV